MHPHTRSARWLILLAIAALAACEKAPIPVQLADPVALSLPTGPTVEGLRLNQGSDGSIVLSWMERLSVGGGALHFSVLEEDGWGYPATVVNDPKMFVNWADTPSVVPLGGKERFAHWLSKTGESTYAYGIQVSHSTDAGATWSDPVAPHFDGTPTEHGFVSILPGANTSQLIWLDGRKMINERSDDVAASSMTLRAASIDANGAVADEAMIDDIVCECCSTDLANTSSGRVAVYRNRTPDEIRDIYVIRQQNGKWLEGEPLSHDGWKISGCPVNGPAVDAVNNLVAVTWFTAANDAPKVQLRLSTDSGRSFGEPVLISAEQVMGQVDVEILNNSAVAVSWLAANAEDSGDVRLAIVTDGAISTSRIVGTTAYGRAVPRMVLQDSSLLFAWVDRNDNGNRLRSVRVPISE